MTFTVMNTRKSLPYWVVPPALRSLNCTKPVFASAKFSTSFSKDTGITAIARTWAPRAKPLALRRHKTISCLAMASASLSRTTLLENAGAPSRAGANRWMTKQPARANDCCTSASLDILHAPRTGHSFVPIISNRSPSDRSSRRVSCARRQRSFAPRYIARRSCSFSLENYRPGRGSSGSCRLISGTVRGSELPWSAAGQPSLSRPHRYGKNPPRRGGRRNFV